MVLVLYQQCLVHREGIARALVKCGSMELGLLTICGVLLTKYCTRESASAPLTLLEILLSPELSRRYAGAPGGLVGRRLMFMDGS